MCVSTFSSAKPPSMAAMHIHPITKPFTHGAPQLSFEASIGIRGLYYLAKARRGAKVFRNRQARCLEDG